jgi:hypothetical protein
MIARTHFARTHRMLQQPAASYPAMGGFRGNGRKANLQE